MAILFMGGEEIDFDRLYGATNITTSGFQFRPDFARCAVACAGGGGSLSNAAMAGFAPSANFWFTARAAINLSYVPAVGTYQPFLAFADSGKPRLVFSLDGNAKVRLSTCNDAGAETVLATSTQGIFASNGLARIDVQVLYGGNGVGRVRVFVNQVVFLDYQGNNTNVSTTLNQFLVSCFNNIEIASTNWSEMIIADQDTRTLSLKTHVPVATAPGHAWLGSQTDINEVVLDESNMITTDTLDTAAKFTVSQLSGGNYGVRAFKVSSWAARGPVGPAHLNLGVNTNGQDSYGPDLSLDTGWGKFSQTFNSNPVTGSGWTQNDINAIQIAAKSKS